MSSSSDKARTIIATTQTNIHVRRASIVTHDEDYNPNFSSSKAALLSSTSQSNRSSPEIGTVENGQFSKTNSSSSEIEDEEIEDKAKPSYSRKTQFINNNIIQIVFFILGWYLFSLTISLYNKWMFDKSKLNFPFPILITSFHQLILSILSFITIKMNPSLRPPPNYASSASSSTTSWSFYLTHVFPCSVASAGDIGFGNTSFRFITLTTYTMVKSSSIAFVLLFGILAKLEKFSYHLLGIVLLMSFGVILMVDKDEGHGSGYNDPKEHAGSRDPTGSIGREEDANVNQYYALGFTLVLLSSCMSGLRWVFTQLLLHKNSKAEEIQFFQVEEGSTNGGDNSVPHFGKTQTFKKNPVFTIYQLAPSMFLILFIIGLFVEGFGPFLNANIWSEKGVFTALSLLSFPGFLVFFMTFFEFGILQRAQVITLSIAGIFKELLTIVVSSFIFGDKLTLKNLMGLILTLVDIAWYNYYRYQIRILEASDEEEMEEDFDKITPEDFELENV